MFAVSLEEEGLQKISSLGPARDQFLACPFVSLDVSAVQEARSKWLPIKPK
jgi:hypothetical protein